MESKIRSYTANYLKLIDKFYYKVLSIEKSSTIRMGYVFFINEVLTLKFETKPDLLVKITKLDYSKKLINLTDKDAIMDGFENLHELNAELFKFYPDINPDTQFTIVYFNLIKKE